MKISRERLQKIFDKTDGRCHICRRVLIYKNYGENGHKSAWEIEHSKPRVHGGKDHLNNLYAAHITCNRSKGKNTTKNVRSAYGFQSAPRSHDKKVKDAVVWGLLGLTPALFVPPQIRILVALLGVGLGAKYGFDTEPD